MTPEEKQQQEKDILMSNIEILEGLVATGNAFEASRQIEIINVSFKYWLQTTK